MKILSSDSMYLEETLILIENHLDKNIYERILLLD